MALPGVAALVLVTAIGLQLSPAVELVAEGSARFDDRGNGVIEVRGGRGWLRMPGIYSDFALKTEFRNVTADGAAGSGNGHRGAEEAGSDAAETAS